MNPDKLQRKASQHKNIKVVIRINKPISNWLKKKNYSPTAIFYQALGDLGYGKEVTK